MMSREDKLKKLKEFGLVDAETSKEIEKDFEKILEQDHKEADNSISNFVRIIKSKNIALAIT